MVLLAHISDLHLNGTPRAAERVKRAVDHLRALPTPPDALLVTGDIADHGDPAEYREAAALLDASFPVLFCPGNHDVRGALRAGLLGERADDRPVNTAHRIGGVTILMCDSIIPGRSDGRLDESTIAWIEDTLSDPGDPGHGDSVLLAMHHPAVPLSHPLPDGMALGNPEALAGLLNRHPRIVAVLAGHAHTAAAASLASRPVLLAPGVTWTLVMPPNPGKIADLEAPVGMALHTVEEDRIVTHFCVVPPAR